MTNETKTDRQRRLARERQRAKRERDALRRAALGGRRFNMDMYQGTADALDLICAAGGFAEPAEVVTLLLHNVAEIAERDASRFAELIQKRNHPGRTKR
ncbi:TPA: hypothetical protein ACXJEI_001367 [Pseudomonas aeruginosa]|uniref:hypothetical protein n=1 Tax=Pseudomonas aeruginosa TaxID=287 RepID=UPI00053DDDC6|nr:hypothetical protein [Pseudomonas aeruginosa]EMB0054523.1 hypothetical protein [Pseudomonas aeruginosa]MBG5618172.1 hypothetical protein [Pseudomonas aeruginosa]MBH9548880.1 hypothetical protein [Pseudomonas aeruginosa]MCG3063573.1 hypothetical protein [Pseudomonas aeruginosa]MCG3075424.1 hypothetical protein [Pseudomonas aeruginosa]